MYVGKKRLRVSDVKGENYLFSLYISFFIEEVINANPPDSEKNYRGHKPNTPNHKSFKHVPTVFSILLIFG